jgi:hypothetical protein
MPVIEISIILSIVLMIGLLKMARMNYELNKEIEEWNKSLKK